MAEGHKSCLLYTSSGDYEGALAAFDGALACCTGKITDLEIDICYYKAAAQYAAQDTEGALETYNAMIDYDGKNANAYYLRGCLKMCIRDRIGVGIIKRADWEA